MSEPRTVESLRRSTPPAGTAGAIAKKLTMTEIMGLDRKRQFPAMLESFKSEIALALPQHLNAERMSRLALSAFKGNGALANCNPLSVFQGVILASQLGLELNVDGQCYLIPYRGEATFVPGWKGYMELLHRAGRADAWTGAVWKGDTFDYALGSKPFVDHKPQGLSDEKLENLLYVYAIGQVHGSQTPVIEVWPAARVWRHRDKHNKVGGKHYSFQNPEMYARKVVLLQVLKYLPKSVELRVAQALDDNPGAKFDFQDFIEGEFSTVAAEAEASRDRGDGPGADPEPPAPAEAEPQAQADTSKPAEPGEAPPKSTKKTRSFE
jgi:recombination protein RecT